MSGSQPYPENLYGPGNGSIGGNGNLNATGNAGNGGNGYFQRSPMGRTMNEDRYRNGSSYVLNDEYISPPHRQTPHNSRPSGNLGSSENGFDYNRSYNTNPDYGNSNGMIDSRREFDSRRNYHSDSTSSLASSLSNHTPSINSPHGLMMMNNRESFNRPPPPPPPTSQQQYNTGPVYDARREMIGGMVSSESSGGGGGGGGIPSSNEKVGKSSANADSNTHPDRKVSCLECRSSKVKCSGQAEGGCDRCKRIKRPCVFEQHRRGRKPAQVKMHKLEQSVDTIMTALSALTEYKRSKEASRENGVDEEEEEEYHRTGNQAQTRKRRAESDTSTNNEDPAYKYAKSRADSSSSVPTLSRSDLASPDEPINHNSQGGGRESNRFSAMLDDVSSRARRFMASRSPSTLDASVAKSEPIDIIRTHADGVSQELGQPPLSNPLKLLAQASDQNVEPARVDSIAATPMKEDYDEAEEMEENGTNSDDVRKFSNSSGKNVKSNVQRRGASRHGYWSIGMYSSRLDKGTALDPISQGLMSHEVARDLYSLYMRHLNAPITLLDPILHTFAFVRSHSALLLSASCALAARFASHINDAEEIANRLDAHIQDVLLPTILLKGYRSVEISQAFIILAAYHPNTQSLDGDRSWSLVGYGIRIAAELDMNARLLSEWSSMGKNAQTPTSVQADTPLSNKLAEDDIHISPEEATQRRLRNRERTWCNLWLFEYSLSTHMGRRSTLSQDPVILGVSAGWHRAPYAIPGDEAIVALIGLRRIQMKNTEFFEHSILSSSYDRPQINTASARFQLDFYRNSSSSDITGWVAMYVDRDEGSSYRMRNASLYASYARLILNSYALKCTTDEDLLDPFYKESYSAAMTYLSMYSERFQSSPGLTYVHNSSVVTVAYVAVFALKLCSLDPIRHPYIDPKLVTNHVRELADALAKAGSVTPWRNGAASSYAPYLNAVVERVERNVRIGTGRRSSQLPLEGDEQLQQLDSDGQEIKKDGLQVKHDRSNRSSEGLVGEKNGIPDDIDTPPKSATGTNTIGLGNSNQTIESSFTDPSQVQQQQNEHQPIHLQQISQNQTHQQQPQHGMGPPTSSNVRSAHFAFGPQSQQNPQSKFHPEALTFLAGPSGVQAATVLDELAVGEDYLRFGVTPSSNGQDHHQFLEGSLFGDMSVFLNASSAANDDTFPWSISDSNGNNL